MADIPNVFCTFAYSIRMKSENMTIWTTKTYGENRNIFENSSVVFTGFGRPSDSTLGFRFLNLTTNQEILKQRWIALMQKGSI